jgi:hypothetical protein
MSARGAYHQRMYRRRQRDGLVVVPVTVPEDDLAAMLVALHLLDPDQADDRQALRAGLEQFLDLQLRALCLTP